MTRLLATLTLLTVLGGTLAACNTTAGAGKDISAAGNAINNTAVKSTP